MPTFTATIRKVWVMRCADVPAGVLRALGGARTVPVLATYAGQTHETTVTPGGVGLGRVHLRAETLRAAGLEVGDILEITLEFDPTDREPELPADFARALARRPDAHAAFDRYTVADRRQTVLYLEKAKREETRERRVEQIIERLAAKTLPLPHDPLDVSGRDGAHLGPRRKTLGARTDASRFPPETPGP